MSSVAVNGNLAEACRVAGVSYSQVKSYIAKDDDFSAKYELAKEIAADALELEARRRAVDGWEETVYYKGVEVGSQRKYSDRLTELLLKADKPEKFKTRSELTGAGGSPIKLALAKFDPEED